MLDSPELIRPTQNHSSSSSLLSSLSTSAVAPRKRISAHPNVINNEKSSSKSENIDFSWDIPSCYQRIDTLDFNESAGDPYKQLNHGVWSQNTSAKVDQDTHKKGAPHVKIAHDNEINKDVLNIILHPHKDDDDKNKQRIEFTGGRFETISGEEALYAWWFKKGKGNITNRFFHLFQIKCRSKALHRFDSHGNVLTGGKVNSSPMFTISLKALNGKTDTWVQIMVHVKYSKDPKQGLIQVIVSDKDGTTLANVTEYCQTFWKNAAVARPRYGLYLRANVPGATEE
eukprot:Awhi_evm1s2421